MNKKSGAGKKSRESDGNVLNMPGADEYTQANVNLQYTLNNTDNDACAPFAKARESPQMIRDVDEGMRLDQVLAAHNLNRARLAKKAGVAASTVQKWHTSLARGDIKQASWNSLARALMAAGIDPKEVRPSADVPTKTHAAALIPPLMAVDDKNVLVLIRDILEIEDQNDREALLAIVRVKLQ